MVPQPDAEDEDRRARGAGSAARIDGGYWRIAHDLGDEYRLTVLNFDLFAAVMESNRMMEEKAWRALGGR